MVTKLTTYKTARGNTFQHVNSKLTTRDASGVVGEYNFTLNVTGDALAHIQKTKPEINNKVSLREYFNTLCGFVQEVKAVVQEVQLPALAVADTSVLTLPPTPKTAKPVKHAVFYDSIKKHMDAGSTLFDAKEAHIKACPQMAQVIENQASIIDSEK